MSNTVALDFGRAVFGRIGGIVFAVMVAFSCFGALNGECPMLVSVMKFDSSRRRFVFHFCPTHLRGRKRGLPSRVVRSTQQDPANAAKRDVPAGSHNDHVHRRRRRV